MKRVAIACLSLLATSAFADSGTYENKTVYVMSNVVLTATDCKDGTVSFVDAVPAKASTTPGAFYYEADYLPTTPVTNATIGTDFCTHLTTELLPTLFIGKGQYVGHDLAEYKIIPQLYLADDLIWNKADGSTVSEVKTVIGIKSAFDSSYVDFDVSRINF